MSGASPNQSDPFAVLGLGQDASADEVKAAYRRLVALYHPDNNPGFPREATQRVRELNDAYAVIRDGRAASPIAAGAATAHGSDPRVPTPVRSPHVNPPRRWDPPRPAPKPHGPQVPPLRYADVPPPRTGPPVAPPSEEALAVAARRAALVDALSAIGPSAPATDGRAAGDDPLVALLVDLDPGTDVRCVIAYDSLIDSGPISAALPEATAETTHVAPSLQVGGSIARQTAIERFVRTRFVAVVGELLLWTTSTLDDGGDILIRERIDATTAELDAITDVQRERGAILVDLGDGGDLRFEADRAALVALGAALGLRP